MRLTALAATAALLAAATPFALAQQEEFGHCGDISLVFMNPDLRPRDDGYVHASGTFFIQFQAIGPNAASVSGIRFSFGKPLPDGAATCDAPGEPLVIAGVPGYRSDATPEDGFYVPINTTLVPDGEYGASVIAYDASGGYLAAFYTKAIVENGPNCRNDRVCEDNTQPWPIILPGDGVQVHPDGGITVEFGEAVADVTVKINGEQVIPRLWTPPARDNDVTPNNDAEECGPRAQLPGNLCSRIVWGSGFHVAREPADGDVIEVRAIDGSGNEATKVVTVGGATQGGAIELVEPELTMTAETTEIEVEAGQSAEYRVKLVNVGSGQAEARMTLQGPEGVATEWSSPSVTVPSGGEEVLTLKATPSQDVRPGGYTLVAKATYKSGTADQEKQLALALKVTEYRPVPESPLRRQRAELNQTAVDEAAADGPQRTPGMEPLLAIGALALLAVARRRRG